MESLATKTDLNILIIGKLAYKLQFSISSKIADLTNVDKNEIIVDGTDLRRQFAGMAGNIAYGLSILEGNPLVISQVGIDFNSFYRTHLERLGVK